MSNKINNEILWADLNYIKNKNHNYYCNMNNVVINKKILVIENK